MASIFKTSSNITDSASEIRKANKAKRLILISVESLVVLLTIMYLISVMYTRFGSFTVSVNKYQQLQYGLSLSETKDFKQATSMLNCRCSEVITNIDGASLDNIDLGAVDGIDNGDNYLCYTFYCANTGKETISYECSIIIANMTLDIEKAVRVRLITTLNENHSVVDYARAHGVDDNGNVIPEDGTVPFYTKNSVMDEIVHDFKPGYVTKYTVVIWLEGNDDDCIDDIIGGEFKIDMKFTVVGLYDDQKEEEPLN